MLAIINGNIIFQKTIEKKDILINDGKIMSVEDNISDPCCDVIDAKGMYIAPGLFDMHVHLREPGYEYKEDIASGTEAALKGGICGLCCMPNTKPCIDNEQELDRLIDKINQKAKVKVYPIASATKGLMGKELSDIENLSKKAVAFSDDGMPIVRNDMMEEAITKCNKYDRLLISHCEMPGFEKGVFNRGRASDRFSVFGIPNSCEYEMITRDIETAKRLGLKIHIAHVSTKEGVEIIRQAKKEGVKVTSETCPHYFYFTEDDIENANYKMNPPLRTEEDRQEIIKGLCDGTIDAIVTDHAPHSKEEKKDIISSPNGIIGLETLFPAAFTKLYLTNKMSLNELIYKMSNRQREILNIENIEIKEGSVADIVIFDDNPFIYREEDIVSKSKNSPFIGRKLCGRINYTIIDGKIAYKREEM